MFATEQVTCFWLQKSKQRLDLNMQTMSLRHCLVLGKVIGKKAGWKESSSKFVFPLFGCTVREERKCSLGRSHIKKTFRFENILLHIAVFFTTNWFSTDVPWLQACYPIHPDNKIKVLLLFYFHFISSFFVHIIYMYVFIPEKKYIYIYIHFNIRTFMSFHKIITFFPFTFIYSKQLKQSYHFSFTFYSLSFLQHSFLLLSNLSLSFVVQTKLNVKCFGYSICPNKKFVLTLVGVYIYIHSFLWLRVS